MAFNQYNLERVHDQSRGGFDLFVYHHDTDTIADITASGYFDETKFGFKSPGNNPKLIKVQCADGPYEVQLVGGVASVVSTNGYVSTEFFVNTSAGEAEQLSSLQSAADYAATTRNKTLYAPSDAVYKIGSGVLTLNGVKLISSGATFESTAEGSGAIVLTGEGGCIEGIKRTYTGAANRSSADNACAILCIDASNFYVKGCVISGSSAAGIMINNCESYEISSNKISGTLADGIHNTNGSNDGNVHGNSVSSTGDDGIAVVSYVAQAVYCSDIEIHNNVVSGTDARGISVVGGYDVSVYENRVSNTNSCGILCASEQAYNTYEWENVSIYRNTVRGCGVDGTSPSIYAHARSGYVSRDVDISGNKIYNSIFSSIVVGNSGGQYVSSASVCSNVIRDSSENAIHIYNTDDIDINNNRVYTCDLYGVYVAGGSGSLNVNGNRFVDVSSDNSAVVDAINVQAGSTFELIQVVGNVHSNPSGNTMDRFLECLQDETVIENNKSPQGNRIGSGYSFNSEKYINRRFIFRSSVPSVGVWTAGDIVFDQTGATDGWRCTVSGDFSGTAPTFVAR